MKMIKEYLLPYGKQKIGIHLDSSHKIDLFLPTELSPNGDESTLVRTAIRNPLNNFHFSQKIGKKTRVAISINDKTRPVPNNLLFPPLLKALQEAGKEGLTREKLLEVILASKTETELSTIVGLTHNGLDYSFFQLLSDKIDASENEDEKKRLTSLREKILAMTEEINKQLQAEMEKSRNDLEKILQSANIEEAMMNNIHLINDFFVHNLETEISQARKKGDLDRINKLEQMMVVIEKLSTPAEAVQLLEELIKTKDEAELDLKIKENQEKFSEEFMSVLNGVIAQYENSTENPQLVEKIKMIFRKVLRSTMKAKLQD